MTVILLSDLKQNQVEELKAYAEKLISGLDRSDTEKYSKEISVAKERTKQYGLGLYHEIDVSKIADYDLDKMKEMRLAMQDGINVEDVQSLSAEEIHKYRYEKLNDKTMQVTTEEPVVEMEAPEEEVVMPVSEEVISLETEKEIIEVVGDSVSDVMVEEVSEIPKESEQIEDVSIRDEGLDEILDSAEQSAEEYNKESVQEEEVMKLDNGLEDFFDFV